MNGKINRIAYLGQMADVSGENGISKKIRAQASQWLKAGHAVRYFSLVPTAAIWEGLRPVEAELLTRGTVARRLFQSFHLARRVRSWRPDVIYFRYAYHSPGLPRLFREVPTVAELNSDDLTEYPSTLATGKLAYHRLTRRRVLQAVAAFVPVTRELQSRFASFAKPSEVIANGIELADFPSLAVPVAGNPLRLVFVGSAGTPWHGLERVAELARLFPTVIIDVVGCTPEEIVTPPPTLRFHGHLSREAYTPLLAGATAAIGTLALFRKKMDEACPLKVREYLAFGLPVLAAYQDTDVPADAAYFLRLPNDSTPLAPQRAAIAAWLEHWRGRRVPRGQIKHLDMAEKERRRLAFMARIATAPRR